ncbi:TadE family protein [Lachnospiraceae bacterium 29-84]
MKRKEQGSLTVEAAFVIPIVLIVMMLVFDQGIDLYTSMVETVRAQRDWEEMDPGKRFRELEWMGNVVPLSYGSGVGVPWRGSERR